LKVFFLKNEWVLRLGEFIQLKLIILGALTKRDNNFKLSILKNWRVPSSLSADVVCHKLPVSEIVSSHSSVTAANENLVVADVDGGHAVLGLLQRLYWLLPLALDVPALDGRVDRPAQRDRGVLVVADAVHGAGVASEK
jgi:hypothetical protein